MQDPSDVYYTVETVSGRKILFLVSKKRLCQYVDKRYRIDGNFRKPETLLKEQGYTISTNIINKVKNK